MKGLIAKRPILYRGRMYQAGDNLPGDDARMVDAWLENDSAERCGESQDNAPDVAKNTQGTKDGGMIAGHLDPKDLEDLKKADLERMATDMGLEISKAKTKADLIAVITAAEVYAPAKNENGGAQ